MTAKKVDTAKDAFVIKRKLDAPRTLVWKAWTESGRLMDWWGPKGFTMRVASLELKPGGVFHYGMQSPEGHDIWGRFVYREIAAPERLVFIVSFSDEQGGIAHHPLSPTWPRETLSTVTFTERGSTTTLTLVWVPHSPTEEERRTFDEGHDSMQKGWTGTLDQLAEYLAKA